jgi:hypothetical protein
MEQLLWEETVPGEGKEAPRRTRAEIWATKAGSSKTKKHDRARKV